MEYVVFQITLILMVSRSMWYGNLLYLYRALIESPKLLDVREKEPIVSFSILSNISSRKKRGFVNFMNKVFLLLSESDKTD